MNISSKVSMHGYWEEIFFKLNESLHPKHRIMLIGRANFLPSFELRTLGGIISSQVKIMYFQVMYLGEVFHPFFY